MPAYNIPRDTSGEGRILFIFSTKALIYTFIGAIIGGIFYLIFKLIGLTIIGVIFVVLFAGIGFSIATFKIPVIKSLPVTKKIGGEKIDVIIRRMIKAKTRKVTKYVLFETTKDEEEKNNGK